MIIKYVATYTQVVGNKSTNSEKTGGVTSHPTVLTERHAPIQCLLPWVKYKNGQSFFNYY